MSIQLDEHAYQKLIDENIIAIEKYMPEHSLEKKHTIEVLKWSVKEIYHKNDKPDCPQYTTNCHWNSLCPKNVKCLIKI